MIDEEVTAFVIVLIVVVGIFSVSSPLIGGMVSDPFSAIAVLGPKMKIGDYPNSVQVNKTLNLYLYVINCESQVKYYIIYVKLGNAATTINATRSANAPIVSSYETILPRGYNTTIPVELSIGKPMTNAKLVFELWTLENNEIKYSGKWCQLWLNITAPM